MTKNKQPIKKTRKNVGRPEVTIDYDLVAKLAMIHCTDAEIACVLGCSESKLQHDAKYIETRNANRGKGKVSLRRMAYNRAEGSDRMLEFLLKNYLGMHDKSQIDHTNSDGRMRPAESTVDWDKLDLETLKKLRDACTDQTGD